MRTMRERMWRIKKTHDPAQRRALMNAQMKDMETMMRSPGCPMADGKPVMGGMGMMGGPGMDMSGRDEMMAKRMEMMEKRMDMMQKNMGPGMNGGMGQGMQGGGMDMPAK
jgi:hypothetical protein